MSTSASFNAEVQTGSANRFQFLQSMARAHNNANQSIPNNTETAVAYQVSDFNTDSMWSSSANTRFTAQVAGKYLVTAAVVWDTQTTSTGRQLFIRKNGSTDLSSSFVAVSGYLNQTITDIVQLSASDYIEITALQFSGAALNVNVGGTQTFGAIVYVGE